MRYLALSLLITVSAALELKPLDCEMRRLAYRYAKKIQPHRDHTPTFEALRLEPLCGDRPESPSAVPPPRRTALPPSAVYVDPSRGGYGQGDGSERRPFRTLPEALQASRARDKGSRTIVLREGIHFLNATLTFGVEDEGTVVVGYPGEDAWVSGGVPLESLKWEAVGKGVYSARVSAKPFTGLFTTTSHERLVRARYPNANPETAQWGYASRDARKYSLAGSDVATWWKPPKRTPPSVTFIDLSQTNPTGHIKNDSAMASYNTYTTGEGGACAAVWGDAPSYWCSPHSAGGWAEVDAECARTGVLGIPIGMTHTVERFAKWTKAKGAVVHAFHPQSWFVNMFEVDEMTGHNLSFSRGGQQGGRNWCRCDQCGYAGPWCKGQDVLFSGNWFVENVLDELDEPGEWYHDSEAGVLYLYPNGTLPDTLIATQLETLVHITGAKNISIANVGFRDAAATFMSDWGVPSGGDWALHRGGAVLIENSENVTLARNTFKRLDGNAVFLASRTRDVLITENEFVWIGDNAMATWGDTKGVDGTGGDQPRGTVVEGNYIHELGVYEVQSSAWGQAKACLTTLRNNIMFNMGRAAINFNDGFGGGNDVDGNLIFNTCRESGDHGPINSWDRMPFLTDVTGTPSFTPLPTTIRRNFIFANYGGSQAVDNDDGSSFYHIEHNVFYWADGMKMDYGGHDSVFTGNLVVNLPYDGQSCVNLGGFLEGHGDVVTNNTCLVGVGGMPTGSGCGDPSCVSGPVAPQQHLEHFADCTQGVARGNTFYTSDGVGTIQCGGATMPLADAQKKYSIEEGSTLSAFPPLDTVMSMARARLGM